MTCARCGAQIAPGSRFCGNCGAAALAPAGAAAAAMAAPPSWRFPAGSHERSLHHLAVAGVVALMSFLCLVTLTILLAEARYSLGALLVSSVMAALAVPLYAAVIVSLDRHVSEPGWLLFGGFFWGAVVATTFAYVINTGVIRTLALSLGPKAGVFLGLSIVAPVVEETAKGAALLIVFFFLRAQLNDVVDGIVIGALVGLGFAMVENVGYFVRIYNAGGFAALTGLFVARVIMFGWGHALYTGATGAGLGLAEETTSPLVRRVAPFAGYASAIILHFLWNTTNALLSGVHASLVLELFVILPFVAAFLGLPGIVTLLAITYFAWRRESTVIAQQLKEEVQRGVVRPGEYGVLADDRKRARRVWDTLFRHGPMAWYLVRQFYNLESALAFRKWHAARGERLPAYLAALSEDAYRDHIVLLRTRLNHMGLSTE